MTEIERIIFEAIMQSWSARVGTPSLIRFLAGDPHPPPTADDFHHMANLAYHALRDAGYLIEQEQTST